MIVTDAVALRLVPAYLFSIVALAVLLPLSAQAQSGPAIVVMPFVSKTVAYENLYPEVPVSFVARLSDELDVHVVVAGEYNRAEPQLRVAVRIFTLESKPALMARITHVDSGRAFGAIVSSRDGETLVEMAQRLAERIGATLTARPYVLSIAPGNAGHRKPSAADSFAEPDSRPLRETSSIRRVRTLATAPIGASAPYSTAILGCGLPSSARRCCG